MDATAPALCPGRGKGDARWRALSVTESGIVAYADADTEGCGEHFLTGLLGLATWQGCRTMNSTSS